MKKIGIYCIKNIESRKVYVGSSVDIKDRLSRHRYQLRKGKHHNIHLQRSWNKYGKDNFEFYVLEECKESKLIDRENYYIKKYKSTNKHYGYNMVSADRRIISNETRKRMSEAQKGKKYSDEYKKKMSEKLKGRKMSEEWKAKIGKAHKGKTISEEHKEQLRAYRTGRKHSDETKIKLSRMLIGNKRAKHVT